jgi:ATP-dependent helicase/nuclease subunit B
MLSGNIEAIPMVLGKKKPCTYCQFSDICGNSEGNVYRTPDAGKIEEAEKILGKSKKEVE